MSTNSPGNPASARCVVCQKEIPGAESRLEVHWRGGHYTVCCPSCAAKFNAAPAMYIVEP